MTQSYLAWVIIDYPSTIVLTIGLDATQPSGRGRTPSLQQDFLKRCDDLHAGTNYHDPCTTSTNACKAYNTDLKEKLVDG